MHTTEEFGTKTKQLHNALRFSIVVYLKPLRDSVTMKVLWSPQNPIFMDIYFDNKFKIGLPWWRPSNEITTDQFMLISNHFYFDITYMKQ